MAKKKRKINRHRITSLKLKRELHRLHKKTRGKLKFSVRVGSSCFICSTHTDAQGLQKSCDKSYMGMLQTLVIEDVILVTSSGTHL